MSSKIWAASIAALAFAALTGCTSVSAAPAPTAVATTPVATSATPAAPTATSVATSAAPTSPTTASPSATATPSASDTTVDPTQNWTAPRHCANGIPATGHIAECKVTGKTQLQVYQACRAAAWGTLWDESLDHRFGIEDPNLAADKRICALGSGMWVGDPDSYYVFGYVKDHKVRTESALKYILVRGQANADIDSMVPLPFFASGPDAGSPANDDNYELSNTIINSYEAAANGR